jgi:Protein of unknown function (DUF2842)
MAMPRKARKVAGAVMLLIFIPIYAMLAVRVAVAHIPEGAILVQTVYFAIAGLIWVLPAGAIIRWMLKPAPEA